MLRWCIEVWPWRRFSKSGANGIFPGVLCIFVDGGSLCIYCSVVVAGWEFPPDCVVFGGVGSRSYGWVHGAKA